LAFEDEWQWFVASVLVFSWKRRFFIFLYYKPDPRCYRSYEKYLGECCNQEWWNERKEKCHQQIKHD